MENICKQLANWTDYLYNHCNFKDFELEKYSKKKDRIHMKELDYIIDRAKKGGASAAEAICTSSESLTITHRDGSLESLDHADSRDIGLRVVIGKRQAFASSSDHSLQSLDGIVDAALIRARAVPEDPYLEIANPHDYCQNIVNFDQHEEFSFNRDALIKLAQEAEDSAKSYPGISKIEAIEAASNQTEITVMTSEGFQGSYKRSRHSLACSAVAGSGDKMQRDYETTASVYFADLDDASGVGLRAAKNTVARMDSRKIKTGNYPVIYDARLCGHYILMPFFNAISGDSIASGSSFLKDTLNQQVFSKHINIVDDPHKMRGFGSRAFDGECLPTNRTGFVEDGILKTWALNLRSGKKLGLKSTSHASRTVATSPGIAPSNLYIEAGEGSLEDAFKDIKNGLYVTELMGFGINGITGDYSMGAAGFWIENGQIAYPVGEITIASNLKTMFRNMYPLNDLKFKGTVSSPSLVIGDMMVAGI